MRLAGMQAAAACCHPLQLGQLRQLWLAFWRWAAEHAPEWLCCSGGHHEGGVCLAAAPEGQSPLGRHARCAAQESDCQTQTPVLAVCLSVGRHPAHQYTPHAQMGETSM